MKKLVKSDKICDKIFVGFLPALLWKETVCGGMAVHRKQRTVILQRSGQHVSEQVRTLVWMHEKVRGFSFRTFYCGIGSGIAS